MGVNIFLFERKKDSSEEETYQLRNFDTNFIVVILAAYSSRSIHTTKSRTHTKKLAAS